MGDWNPEFGIVRVGTLSLVEGRMVQVQPDVRSEVACPGYNAGVTQLDAGDIQCTRLISVHGMGLFAPKIGMRAVCNSHVIECTAIVDFAPLFGVKSITSSRSRFRVMCMTPAAALVSIPDAIF